MGRGGAKKPLPEIDETRASLKDDLFDMILKRVESSGEIISDESTPMYTDVGMDEFEVGYERAVQFSLNKTDFMLIRKVETHVLQGGGRQKHVEELSSPRSRMILKKKSVQTGAWEVMDLEDMF